MKEENEEQEHKNKLEELQSEKKKPEGTKEKQSTKKKQGNKSKKPKNIKYTLKQKIT